jgi:proteasome lid subunit RPN8/RPN11
MGKTEIRQATFDAIVAEAERAYPDECCGFIIGDDRLEELRPITNIQNRKHAEDARAFPRDARTAFLMDPGEQLAALVEMDERKLELRALYHSHPDHDAYFSATDRARACSFDPNEPDYPDTLYIVISVRNGKFAQAAAFAWDAQRKEFAETAITLAP